MVIEAKLNFFFLQRFLLPPRRMNKYSFFFEFFINSRERKDLRFNSLLAFVSSERTLELNFRVVLWRQQTCISGETSRSLSTCVKLLQVNISTWFADMLSKWRYLSVLSVSVTFVHDIIFNTIHNYDQFCLRRYSLYIYQKQMPFSSLLRFYAPKIRHNSSPSFSCKSCDSG